jgi:DNA mismatch repair protein MutS
MIVHMKGTERSYQIEVAPPEGKSYASEIAKKYEVTYEMLVK